MPNQDYGFRRLLELDACTGCRLCAEVCPAVAASGEGRLSGVYRLAELRRLVRARTSLWRRLLGRREPSAEELDAFSQTVFRCTLCGNCQAVCPAGLGLKDLWLNLRQDLNRSNHYPEKVDLIRDNLQESHNVFAEDNEERAEWVEDCDEAPEDSFCRDQAEVVYFTGCVAAFFPLAQQIPVALAEVLTAAGVDFTLLGEEEWCCGFPLLGAGLADRTKEVIDHNLAAVRAKGAKAVVFACPSCYHMWAAHYPAEVELYHASQYLDRLIAAGRLSLKETPLTVTYHDPCDLGRASGEYEAPRRVIRSIPGVKLVELARNRADCQCCGGGGNLEMVDADLSAGIAKRKIEEVLATGAEAVVSSCQQCLRTMAAYARRNQLPLKVLDLTQLVRRALRG